MNLRGECVIIGEHSPAKGKTMFDILLDFALLAVLYVLLYRLRLRRRDRRYRVWFTLMYV